MEIVKWELDEKKQLLVMFERHPEEKVGLEQLLASLEKLAAEKNFWLLGRMRFQQEKNFLWVQTCVLPVLKLPELDGREEEYRLKEPTETEIDQQIQLLARPRTISTEDDDPARMGDLLTIDYDAVLEDGSCFSGSRGRNGVYRLVPGEDFPEAVCWALVGKKAGDSFGCKTQLPNTYPDKRAAGKLVSYTGSVRKIVHQTLPAIDEAFARSFGVKDLAALRQKLKEEFLQKEALAARKIVTQRALHAFCDEAAVQPPQLAVDLETEYQWHQLEERLRKSNISLESHLKRLQKTRQKLEESLKHYSAEEIKMRMVFLAVAHQNGFIVTDAELETAARGYTGMNLDRIQLRQRLEVEKGMHAVTERLRLKPAVQ